MKQNKVQMEGWEGYEEDDFPKFTQTSWWGGE
jgi:hypothetical protein